MLIAVLYLALTMCTPIEYTKNLFIEHISKYMPTRSLIEESVIMMSFTFGLKGEYFSKLYYMTNSFSPDFQIDNISEAC